MNDLHKDTCNINYGGMCDCGADEAMCYQCERVGCRECKSRMNRKGAHLSKRAITIDWAIAYGQLCEEDGER